MRVRSLRLSEHDELGTHFASVERFAGNDEELEKGSLWLRKTEDTERGFMAEIVGGCANGLAVFSKGKFAELCGEHPNQFLRSDH